MPANDYIITGEKEEYLKEFEEQAKILEEKFTVIEAIGLEESDRKIIEEVKTGVEGIKKTGYAIFDIEKPIGNRRAAELMEEMDYKYSAPAAEKTGLLVGDIAELRVRAGKAAISDLNWVITVLVAGTIAAAVLSLIIAVILARSITRPLREMTESASRISTGDVDVEISIKGKDEVGRLADSFRAMVLYLRAMAGAAETIAEGDLRYDVTPMSDNDALGNAFKEMIASLRKVAGELKGGATPVVSATSEIAATSEQSKRNVENSGSAVEEITATMHEMSANIRNVVKGMQQQSVSVTETTASIEELIASIQKVAENSKRLVDIARQSSEIGRASCRGRGEI